MANSDFKVNVGLRTTGPDITDLIKQVQSGFKRTAIRVKLDVDNNFSTAIIKGVEREIKKAQGSVKASPIKIDAVVSDNSVQQITEQSKKVQEISKRTYSYITTASEQAIQKMKAEGNEQAAVLDMLLDKVKAYYGFLGTSVSQARKYGSTFENSTSVKGESGYLNNNLRGMSINYGSDLVSVTEIADLNHIRIGDFNALVEAVAANWAKVKQEAAEAGNAIESVVEKRYRLNALEKEYYKPNYDNLVKESEDTFAKYVKLKEQREQYNTDVNGNDKVALELKIAKHKEYILLLEQEHAAATKLNDIAVDLENNQLRDYFKDYVAPIGQEDQEYLSREIETQKSILERYKKDWVNSSEITADTKLNTQAINENTQAKQKNVAVDTQSKEIDKIKDIAPIQQETVAIKENTEAIQENVASAQKAAVTTVKSSFNPVTSTSYKNSFKEFTEGFTKKSPELQKMAAYYKQAAKEADAFAAANNKLNVSSGKDFFKNFDTQFQKSPELQKIAAYYAEIEKSYTSLMAEYNKYNATGYMDTLQKDMDSMLPRASVEQANEAKAAIEGLRAALLAVNSASGGAGNATTDQLQALADAGKQAETAMSNLSRADSVIKSQLAQDAHIKRATNTLQNYFDKYRENILKNSGLTNRFNQIMSDIASDKYKGNWNQLSDDIAQYQRDCQAAGVETQSLGQKLKNLFGQHLSTAIAMLGVNALRQGLRQVYQNVVELDGAMLELRKVTDETRTTYNRFFQEATVRARELGATLTDTINASADFARLGYNLKDAADLADAALVYKNVGDGIEDISESSESIISSMKANNCLCAQQCVA